MNNQTASIISFYAISPIHAGSGSALGAVDLPIQRERHTNWPHIQATGVKGAMRAHYRNYLKNYNGKNEELENFIFGTEDYLDSNGEKSSVHGAISVSDAKLLAFPMRSNIAPFVWVTSPEILMRLNKDLELIGKNGEGFILDNIPKQDEALCLKGGLTGKILLEDALVEINGNKEDFSFLGDFTNITRLLMVSDEIFEYCVTNCTEVQTQIKIDEKTGTAKDGSLRYEEFLPTDTVLYSILVFNGSSVKNDLQASTIKDHLKAAITSFIQIGGDETLGRGICKIEWINGGN